MPIRNPEQVIEHLEQRLDELERKLDQVENLVIIVAASAIWISAWHFGLFKLIAEAVR